MKSLFSLILFLSFSTAVSAQTALDEQIALVRQSAHTDRKIILMGNVNFTADESAQFWPAWNEYRAAVSANGDRLLALIQNYAANYETLTDQKANELLSDYFSVEMQSLVIKQKFSQEINLFMPEVKVMRIIQIENKLDAAINLQLASEIPLAQ